jgi:4-amino-4-deoxy-L-arabinose transferase-like glycosyltransferase
MFTVYQCAAYLKTSQIQHILLAGVGVGLALLTKGPIGALIPVIALGMDRLLTGQWRDLLKPQWLLAILVAIVVITPMCYGLYTQFDLHPEKTAYGLQGPSGIKFFFWTQSFGRITGDIYWDNNAPWYYFLTSFLWDFMPWAFVGIAGFIYALRRSWSERQRYIEYFTIGGFTLVFVLLSLSKYKLPHYIFPIFPFIAILTARYLSSGMRSMGRMLVIVQLVLIHAFFGAMVFVFIKCFPPDSILLPAGIGIGYVALWSVYFKFRTSVHRVFLMSAVTAICFNLFLSTLFYPRLLQYQSGALAGKVIHQDKMQHVRSYYTYDLSSNSLDFYSGAWIPKADKAGLGQVPSQSWIFTTESGYQEILSQDSGEYQVVREFDDYHITKLKMRFVLKASRPDELTKHLLVEKL